MTATVSLNDRRTGPAEDRTASPRAAVLSAVNHPLFTYRLVVVTSAVLLSLGLMMVISASSVIGAAGKNDPYFYGKRQIIFAAVGVLGAWALSMLPERVARMISRPAMILALILMILTFTPAGVAVAGNRNWLSFGPAWTQFQPSEFAKVALILWGAEQLASRGKKLVDLREWGPYLLAAFLVVGLVVFQKDQGTAMVILAMVIVILVAAGFPWRWLAGLVGAAAIGVATLVVVEPYRMRRIWAFLNPDDDPLGLNMQAGRGIEALASGGWFGQGLGSSRLKWGLLSEAHTDYIFAIIGEELGVMGTVTVIALFLILAYAGIRIANRSDSVFSRLVAVGVVSWFTVQAFVNIAVAVRAFPVMGVTLPMISYGGSSLMANLFALGLLAGCARHEPAARELLEANKGRSRK